MEPRAGVGTFAVQLSKTYYSSRSHTGVYSTRNLDLIALRADRVVDFTKTSPGRTTVRFDFSFVETVRFRITRMDLRESVS